MSDELLAQFVELGVPDPEGWAQSQRSEGIDQMARATVLRRLADIVEAAPAYWNSQTEDHVTAEVRAAAERLKSTGARSEDIDLVLKSTLWEVVFEILGYLADSRDQGRNPAGVDIALYRLDEDFEPIGDIGGLHESWREVASHVLGQNVVAS